MGFWDSITGFTFDGLPSAKMSDHIKLVYSIKNHLRQLINTPKGSDWKNADMGVEDIPDALTSVPSWTQSFGKSLKSMIKKYEKRIKEIYFINWRIDNKKIA